MSTINTNGINVNYPIPGVNNNTQGFRDNFASTKNNLDIAASEISDLQNKVVVKSALNGTTLNNDMANTLISNAAVRGFRSPTYNLGNALTGSILIDVSLGDVQYGTVAGDLDISFCNWGPTGTQSNLQLQLAVSNSAAVITFPSEVVQSNNNFGTTTLENYANVANTPTVTVPYNVSQLDYNLSTNDCGTTINIEQYNRPRQTTQIQQRTPSPTGFQGDVEGTVAIDTSYLYVCTGSYDSGGANTVAKTATATTVSTNEVTLNNVTSLVANAPIIFTGTTFGGIVADQIYYIKTIVGGNSAVTLSDTRTGGTAGSTFVLSTSSGTMTATSYNGTSIWKRIALTAW